MTIQIGILVNTLMIELSMENSRVCNNEHEILAQQVLLWLRSLLKLRLLTMQIRSLDNISLLRTAEVEVTFFSVSSEGTYPYLGDSLLYLGERTCICRQVVRLDFLRAMAFMRIYQDFEEVYEDPQPCLCSAIVAGGGGAARISTSTVWRGRWQQATGKGARVF